jgi:hypothetical protein
VKERELPGVRQVQDRHRVHLEEVVGLQEVESPDLAVVKDEVPPGLQLLGPGGAVWLWGGWSRRWTE